MENKQLTLFVWTRFIQNKLPMLLANTDNAAVRSKISYCLAVLLDYCKQMIASAQISERAPFTSFSQSLTVTVMHLYRLYLGFLKTEKLVSSLCQHFKVLNVLCYNSSFVGLDLALPSEIISAVLKYTRHSGKGRLGSEKDADPF